MHRILTILSALLVSSLLSAASAQSKISVGGLAAIQRINHELSQSENSRGAADKPAPSVTAIVSLMPDGSAADLESAGFNVVSSSGSTAVVSLPLDRIERLAAMDMVRSVSIGGKRRLYMDLARTETGVNTLHTGTEIDGTVHRLTGKGVITGMVDCGLEANHVNFLADGSSMSRIASLWHYTGEDASQYNHFTPANIRSFTCDDTGQTHATHVAGILCGSYNGTGTFQYTSGPSDMTSQTITGGKIPYYGVATQSTPVFAVGQLFDGVILAAIENIISYAEEKGMPAVINLSFGSNTGPHDGTDNFASAINDFGDRAIICMSAGNEGDMKMSIEKKLTADESEIHTFLIPQSDYEGIDSDIAVWASDGQPLTVTMSVYQAAFRKSTPIASLSGAGSRNFNKITGMTTGNGGITAGIDPNNSRFNTIITPYTAITLSRGYYLELTVKGTPGQTINIYYGGYGDFSSKDKEGYTDGSSAQSINNDACGENVISVGSYVTRELFGVLGSGDTYMSWGETPGSISSFSSFGTTADGTPLPVVLAPGSSVISSYNRYYTGATSTATAQSATPLDSKAKDYWGYMDGTSMASPFASGVIALWLEADPTLTAGEIKEIISETSVTDTYTAMHPAAAGAGKINAVNGLRRILSSASTGTMRPDDADTGLIVSLSGSQLLITLAGEAAFTATLCDMQGRTVATAAGRDAEARIDTSGLMPGIYIVSVSGDFSRHTRKISIR